MGITCRFVSTIVNSEFPQTRSHESESRSEPGPALPNTEHIKPTRRSELEHLRPIECHSMLSDQRTVAIVSPDARVNWMCAPRIDSPALFAELVDGPAAGYFSVQPAHACNNPEQRYIDDTMVIETSWASMTATDYLDCSDGRTALPAGRTDLLRTLTGVGKAVVEFAPRLDFGRQPTLLRQHGNGLEVIGNGSEVTGNGLEVIGNGSEVAGNGSEVTDNGSEVTGDDYGYEICLLSPGVEWAIEQNGQHHTARALIDLSAGPVTLELRCGTSDLTPGATETDRRAATVEHWRSWVDSLTLPSPRTSSNGSAAHVDDAHIDMVRRSALLMKALCYEPTGAIVAAATTSLPECIGGVRNWDYRYCWIRDGMMTAATLVRLGSTSEAIGILDWLARLIDDNGGTSLNDLAPLHTVDGGALPPETHIPELTGYGGSRPVRVGNAADRQVQIDVFGPVMELMLRLQHAQGYLAQRHWKLAEQVVEAVQQCWHLPDQGIWEFRTPPRHYVHSKTMCWLTVDRALQISLAATGRTIPEWERLRDAIATEVMDKGWHSEVGTFTAAYCSAALDSSVLMVGLSGLVAPDDPRLSATIAAIEESLRLGTGVYRYRSEDGLPGAEGSFNLMTSWLIDAKILTGDIEGARSLLDSYAALTGPTGLMSEQHDPITGLCLGNLPQAYSHLGLIENILNLVDAEA